MSVEDCEAALVAHWSQLGELPGAALHDEDGLVWFETPVRHLPYNGVVRIRLGEGEAADRAIARVLGRLEPRGADSWWAVTPTATPADVGERLSSAGVKPVERMNFMALDLDRWTPPDHPAGVTFHVADDPAAIRAYTDLTLLYWEIPHQEHDAVAELHGAIGPHRNPGVRFLARIDGDSVGKAYLSFAGPEGLAAIYGMSVKPSARGRGVAGGLTSALLARARQDGCQRAVLHATDMAVGVYERAGFTGCGSATVHATASIWTDEH
jgi:ribosomal protein S18 acetylase RimI-like enzyme